MEKQRKQLAHRRSNSLTDREKQRSIVWKKVGDIEDTVRVGWAPTAATGSAGRQDTVYK